MKMKNLAVFLAFIACGAVAQTLTAGGTLTASGTNQATTNAPVGTTQHVVPVSTGSPPAPATTSTGSPAPVGTTQGPVIGTTGYNAYFTFCLYSPAPSYTSGTTAIQSTTALPTTAAPATTATSTTAVPPVQTTASSTTASTTEAPASTAAPATTEAPATTVAPVATTAPGATTGLCSHNYGCTYNQINTGACVSIGNNVAARIFFQDNNTTNVVFYDSATCAGAPWGSPKTIHNGVCDYYIFPNEIFTRFIASWSHTSPTTGTTGVQPTTGNVSAAPSSSPSIVLALVAAFAALMAIVL